jgi:hypothetical protein
MDLGLYARVIRRFKFLVAGGFVLALALAVFAMAKPSFAGGKPTLIYRTPKLFQTKASLLLTQQGFPWGRSDTNTLQFAGYVGLYSKFVNSDAVQSRLHLKKYEAVVAQPDLDTSIIGATSTLPILGIAGIAPTSSKAMELANRAARVFQRYIDQTQGAAGIPESRRVVLQMINRAPPAELAQGHKKTVPMLVFMMVMAATLGLAFILENLRPRLRVVPASDSAERESRAKSA